MIVNDENINVLNLPKEDNKENIQNNKKASDNKQKPKNQIKVKLNPDINPINKGLNIIDQNNNCIKNSKNMKEEKLPNHQKKSSLYVPKHKQKESKSSKMDISSKSSIKKPPTGFNSRNINLFLNKRESDSLLLNYGEDCYYFNKYLEKTTFKIPDTLLQNHKITSNVRTKMVDWMVEVLSVFDCMDETFFLSINIMDIFFLKTKKIYHNEDIHLIGLTSMFISSKFQEIYPLSLKNFVKKIAHNMFTENDIKMMEKEILEDIDLEILVSTSVYDFLKTYFYDFLYNNKELIKMNCDMSVFNEIKLVAKYLSKLVVHYEYFYLFENSMKAIGCIITAIKLVGLYWKEKFSQKERNIFNQWMLFLMNQDNFRKEKMDSLVNKIYLAFNHYQKSKSIGKNLNRFMKLSFINQIQI